MSDLFDQLGAQHARDFEAEIASRPVRPRGRHVKPAPEVREDRPAPATNKRHLYDVMDYAPREQFEGYHARTERHACIVAHRRCGKTVAAVADLVRLALACKHHNPQAGYIAPYRVQAKQVAWTYLQDMCRALPGYKANQSDLSCNFKAMDGIAKVMLGGADNPDTWRGWYLDAVCIDEPAQVSPRLFPEVIRPALSDRNGKSTFIGTPAGRNAFYQVYDRAQNDDDWFTLLLRASQTGILQPLEVEALKREMSDNQYRAEFECDWGAATMGAYYGKEMADAWIGNRITGVHHDPSLPVHVVMDLGFADLNSTWLFQIAGTECRLIQHLDYQFTALPEIINDIKTRLGADGKPMSFGAWIAPHDIRVRELGSGKSRLQIAAENGVNFEVAPNVSIEEGIERVRMLLGRCWFDKERAGDGVLHLEQYRSELNEKTGRLKATPRHDEHSHAADAFRYLALSGVAERGNWATMSEGAEDLDYSEQDVGVI